MSFLSSKAQKADGKDGVICLIFMSPSRVMVVILSKIVPFLQFFTDVSKKSKVVIAILCSCIWKFSFGSFRKWYWLLHYDLEFRRYQHLKFMNFVKFLLNQHFFDILILNIAWTVAHTPIKHTIFWKNIMRSFRRV